MKVSKLLALATGAAIAVSASVQIATADTSKKRIALSNNYAGNSWPAGHVEELVEER